MIQINVLAMPNNEICIVLNEYQILYQNSCFPPKPHIVVLYSNILTFIA